MAIKATSRVNVPMAAVRIGYLATLILPLTKASQLVTLLQSAATCEERYGGGLNMTYTIGDQPEIQMTVVKPAQMRFAPAEGGHGNTLAIGFGDDGTESF